RGYGSTRLVSRRCLVVIGRHAGSHPRVPRAPGSGSVPTQPTPAAGARGARPRGVLPALGTWASAYVRAREPLGPDALFGLQAWRTAPAAASSTAAANNGTWARTRVSYSSTVCPSGDATRCVVPVTRTGAPAISTATEPRRIP